MADDFEKAQADVKTLSKAPDSGTLLQLYSLYKQGTSGDVTGKRPGMLDVRGRAKYDAWTAKKGLSQDEAKTQYVALVAGLLGG